MDKNFDNSMVSSAGKVASATAFSRILGLIREQVVAVLFGAGMLTDCFVAAFRIPNLLRDLFAEGALSSAFVPVFKEKLVKLDKADAFRLANITISALLLVVGLTVSLGIIFSPQLVYISAKGFTANPEKFDLTVNLTRLMFVYLLLVSVSAVLMGILNSTGRFGIPALSPALFNLGMILTPILLYKYFSAPIYTLALGVIIGGLGQLVFQLPSMHRIGFRFHFVLDFYDAGLRKIVRLITPMMLGLSASRINILINTLLASFLIEGAISYLNFSYRLMHFPLGVFAVALGTVALPKASEDVARGDNAALGRTFSEAFGLNMFLVIPSAAFLAFFGYDIVRLIFQYGAFGTADTVNTAQALFYYAFGLIGFAGVRVVAPVYYALGDSKRPMLFSILAVAINIGLNFVLIPFLNFAGLAAATGAAGLANLGLLLIYLKDKIPGLAFRPVLFQGGKTIIASAVAVGLTKLLIYFVDIRQLLGLGGFPGNLAVVTLEITGLVVVYLVLSIIMKLDELPKVISIFRARVK